MESSIETIKRRVSIRTYMDVPLEGDTRRRLLECLANGWSAPFGSRMRFELVDLEEGDSHRIRTLATYGVITGGKLYIIGAVARSEWAMLDYGYAMEKIVLLGTDLGLGTCWLGGFFRRGLAGSIIGASKDELVPAITPVGYAASKQSGMDTFSRAVARGWNRKSWDELFFSETFSTPLQQKELGGYGVALESVRLGPSASNLQPWRVVAEPDRRTFHFYLHPRRLYNRVFKDIQLQMLDMGIAMCHFELSASELGLRGSWKQQKPNIDSGRMEYVVTWTGQPLAAGEFVT